MQLLEKTLERRKIKLGTDHEDTLTNMENLAVIFVRLGRYQEGIALQETVVEPLKPPETKPDPAPPTRKGP